MSDRGAPTSTAEQFVAAIAWGEHTTVWDLLSSDARLAVLGVATRRGMDALLSARLREGTASTDERDDFLADLLHGLQSELLGLELETLRFVRGGTGSTLPGSVVVLLVIDVPAELGELVPVARMELVKEPDRWSVVRLDAIR